MRTLEDDDRTPPLPSCGTKLRYHLTGEEAELQTGF